jgi:hypothetical protein
MKQVIQLDAAGYFVGLTTADESPLEPGVYLLPAGAVDALPPTIPEGHRAKWNGAWVFEEIPQPEPEPKPESLTPEQIAATERANQKWVGIEFEGVMCSATREDQNGLIAVLLAFQMQGAQFKPTEFHFANGSKLVLSQANIPEFIGVWMPFRQSFFSPA